MSKYKHTVHLDCNSFRMGGEFSEQLKNWILDHISSMSPDGATTAQHSARAIADDCEGCVLITRNFVHELQGLFDAAVGVNIPSSQL